MSPYLHVISITICNRFRLLLQNVVQTSYKCNSFLLQIVIQFLRNNSNEEKCDDEEDDNEEVVDDEEDCDSDEDDEDGSGEEDENDGDGSGEEDEDAEDEISTASDYELGADHPERDEECVYRGP